MASVEIIVTDQDGTTKRIEQIGYANLTSELKKLIDRAAESAKQYIES